jgi:hypothetical protein
MLNKGKQEGNMFKKTLLVLFSVLVLSCVCFAQEEPAEEPMEDTTAVVAEEPELVLEDIAICTAVEDRQPVGAGTVFTDDLDKIYCFTRIGGAEDTTSVNHVWYFNDKEIVKVNLAVKSVSWRTWSSKMVNMGLGKGYVEIVSEGGDILGKAEFEIKAAEEEEAEETEEAVEESTEEE